jgi:LAO/AO transport system kinase
MVDFFLLLQVTGTGDELQGIKRGIMEMADGIAINKCDGNNVERAEAARVSFKNALSLFPPTESGWKPYAVTCSAIEGNGILNVWKMVEEYISFARENGYLDHLRTQQAKYWMYETINQNLLDSFYKSDVMEVLISETEERVLKNEISSFTAAYELLKRYGSLSKEQ